MHWGWVLVGVTPDTVQIGFSQRPRLRRRTHPLVLVPRPRASTSDVPIVHSLQIDKPFTTNLKIPNLHFASMFNQKMFSGIFCQWSSPYRPVCSRGCFLWPVLSLIQAQSHAHTLKYTNTTHVPDQMSDRTILSILQLNCNGLKNKHAEITNYMLNNNIHVAALQETKLTPQSKLRLNKHFILSRQDRLNKYGGGLAFIINRNVKYNTYKLPPKSTGDETLEQYAIYFQYANTSYVIINIYIPPVSCCPPHYDPNITHLLRIKKSFILGDFNAHHRL